MDQRLLKFSLRPGTEDPGYGHWGAPMYIPQGGRLGLVATFNSGFRVSSSGGGFYLHGHYDGRLVNGRGLRGLLQERPDGDRHLGTRPSAHGP